MSKRPYLKGRIVYSAMTLPTTTNMIALDQVWGTTLPNSLRISDIDPKFDGVMQIAI